MPIPPEPPPNAVGTEEQGTQDRDQNTIEGTEETVPDNWEAEITIRRVLTEVEEIAAERQEEKRRKKLKLFVGWDLLPDKAPNCTRVGFINLQHLSHNKNDSRSRFLIDQMRHYKFNVLMMCEHNVRMHKLEAYHNWYERSSKTLGPQSFIFANNRTDDHNTELRQIGGTAIVAMQETKTRVLNKGEDPHRLGRWAWMLIQGRHGHHTRMVSAYRPNKSLTTAGTVYRQQLRHWRDKNIFDCPLKLFEEHLEEEIKGWMLLGDHLMIGIDANEDVRTGTVATMLRRLGLRDLLLDGLLQGTAAPETNIRNTNSMPIDAIFVTPGLMAAIGGFSRYNQMAMSDHRMPWADIPNEYFLGHNPPQTPPPTFRRINGKDPRSRDKYNKVTKKEYAKAENAIPTKLANLQQLRADKANAFDVMWAHQQLLESCMKIRLETARRMRHFYSGNYEWSLEWTRLDKTVKYWATAKKKFHTRIRGRTLQKMSRQASLPEECLKMQEEECKLKWAEAKTAFEKFKPSASKVAAEMRISMSKAIADKNGTDPDAELKKLSRHAKQRETGLKIRRVNKKLKKGFVHKFVITDPLTGAVTAVEDKQGMEALSEETNTLRWTACEISEFMHDPILLEDIGMCCEGPEIEAVLNGTYEPPEHLTEATKRVLRSLAQPEVIKNNPMPTVEITLESHQWAWQHVKEATASAPQTLDFSHYIAASFETTCAELDLILREAPLQYGFAPDAWNPMADCFIPKKEEELLPDKMRTICLMDASYNMNNKWYGRAFMQHNEALGTLEDEQEGSRKDHNCPECVLKKILCCDVMRQLRRAGFL